MCRASPPQSPPSPSQGPVALSPRASPNTPPLPIWLPPGVVLRENEAVPTSEDLERVLAFLHDNPNLVKSLVSQLSLPPLNPPIPKGAVLSVSLRPARATDYASTTSASAVNNPSPTRLRQGIQYFLRVELSQVLEFQPVVHCELVFADGHQHSGMSPHVVYAELVRPREPDKAGCQGMYAQRLVVFARTESHPLRLIAHCPNNPHCHAEVPNVIVSSTKKSKARA